MADDKKITEKSSKSVEKLVEEISKLSVLELSDLVNSLQEKLGVSAIAAAPVPQTLPVAPVEGQPLEGQQSGSATQTLIMTASGANKISVIKALREINQNWGLKEAKDMTEAVPVEILKDAKADDVKVASEKLKAAGATFETK